MGIMELALSMMDGESMVQKSYCQHLYKPAKSAFKSMRYMIKIDVTYQGDEECENFISSGLETSSGVLDA